MFKKSVSFLFIIVANLILLAHALIPHHHHNLEVCLNADECSFHNDFQSQNQEDKDHKHNHNHSSDTECCVLKQAVVIPTNFDKLKTSFFDYKILHNTFYDCQLDFLKVKFDLYFQDFKNKAAPFEEQLYTQSVNIYFGLRAPPIV